MTGSFPSAVTAALCAAAVALTGCGKPPAPNDPGPISTSSAVAEPGRPHPTEAPTDPPSGAQFTFAQAAEFGDGLLIEISQIARGDATATQTGAEGTAGDIVIVEILVTNKSTRPVTSDDMQVWGYYNDVGAPKIVDSTGAVGDSFSGVVPAGEQARATMAFAMPHDDLSEVTIMIDGGTPEHGTIRFTGPVP